MKSKNGEYKGIKSPFDAKKGTEIQLEKPGYILKDTLVYKTSSVKLLEEAKLSYQIDRIKYPVDMEISIKIGEKPKLMVISKDKVASSVADFIVEKSERVSLTKEKIEEQLSKLGDTTYELNNLNISLDEGSYLPVSTLNSLRREAINELDNLTINLDPRDPIEEKEYIEKKRKIFEYDEVEKEVQNNISIKVSNIEQFHQLDLEKLDRVYLGFYDELEYAVKKVKSQGKEVYLSTEKILYKRDLEDLNKIIKSVEEEIDGVSASNFGTIKYIKDNFDLKIHGDIGLNVFNSYTLKYLNEIGLDTITLSPELNMNQIRSIEKKTNINTEVIVYGHLTVMTTKYCPMSLVKGCKDDNDCRNCNFARGYSIKDRIGANFQMERKQGFTNIYNSVPLMVLDNLKEIYNSRISMGRLDFTVECQDIGKIQRAYYDYAKSLMDDNQARKFIDDFRENKSITNGHYFRGVM